jgi:hypothetical protein
VPVDDGGDADEPAISGDGRFVGFRSTGDDLSPESVGADDAYIRDRLGAVFSDVPPTHAFYAEIQWLAASGITGGLPNGTYQPTAPVARQAMAAFLYRAAGAPPFNPPPNPTFTDVGPNHPFRTEIEWLAASGITGGLPNGTYQPTAPVARQAMAAFLARASSIREEAGA